MHRPRLCPVMLLALLASRAVADGFLPGYHQLPAAAWLETDPRLLPGVAGRGLVPLPLPAEPAAARLQAATTDRLLAAIDIAGWQALAVIRPAWSNEAPGPDGEPLRSLVPPGLDQPIFNHGRDEATGATGVNPANQLAASLAALAERYDGDGLGDAPGSPRITHWAIRPVGAADGHDGREAPRPEHSARAVQVARQVIRWASEGQPTPQIGLDLAELDRPALIALLRARGQALRYLLDFVICDATSQGGSEAVYLGEGGLVGRMDAVSESFAAAGGWAPALLSRVAFAPAGTDPAAVARAAAVKAQIAGVAHDYRAVLWPAAARPDGRLGPPTDADYALRTLQLLLGECFARSDAGYVEALTIGNLARCHRFLRPGGGEVLVAWACDLVGEPEQDAAIRLPLRVGTRYARYRWDYSLTGQPAELLVGERDDRAVTVGGDPEYFVSGWPQPSITAIDRPAPQPAPPWRLTGSSGLAVLGLAVDRDAQTAWRSGDEPRPWWQLDAAPWPLVADRVTVTVGRDNVRAVTVQTSVDGAVWDDAAKPVRPVPFAPTEIKLTRRVAAWHWRVIFQREAGARTEVRLHEVRIGDWPARDRRGE